MGREADISFENQRIRYLVPPASIGSRSHTHGRGTSHCGPARFARDLDQANFLFSEGISRLSKGVYSPRYHPRVEIIRRISRR